MSLFKILTDAVSAKIRQCLQKPSHRCLCHVLPLSRSSTIIHTRALFELPTAVATRPEYPWTLVPARNFSAVLSQDSPTAIPCWTSREACLLAINVALLGPAGVALRRRYEVSLKSVMCVARTDAMTADSATGRNVSTAHRTGARLMARSIGVVRSSRTYRKARAILRALGFLVVIDEGRYLTKTEILQASLLRGQNDRRPQQRRKASTRMFTMAKSVVEKIGHLPRRGSTSSKLTSVSTHQGRAKARRASPKQGNWGLPLQRLAAKLVNEATFLRSVRPGVICRALHGAGINPDWWTAHDVARAMYADVAAKRWTAPAEMANPAGYFRFLLSTIDPGQISAHVERKRKDAAGREARLASARAATRRAEARFAAKMDAGK